MGRIICPWGRNEEQEFTKASIYCKAAESWCSGEDKRECLSHCLQKQFNEDHGS